ncbi:MAG: hypothetical protein ACOH2T_24070 [Pseudomonas sp.]
MKLFLDCEFTQLNKDTKLISLALVALTGEEFYVELSDTYTIHDCSDFVIQNVLPQLDVCALGKPFTEAQALLWRFLGSFDMELEICSDAPEWDWDFFCDLAYVKNRWPANVVNRATNLVEVFSQLSTDDLNGLELPQLPHHALLDARILASMYRQLPVPRG